MKNYLKATIFCFILLFFGCKKSINNSNSDQIASSENFAVTKFLSVPENLSPDIKEIVRDISKQQIKEPFLADFINKYGIPKWDKTITSHPALLNNDNSQTKSNSVDNQADFVSPIYLIPLIDTNSNNVKSYILCTRVQDSLFRYNVFNKQSILEKPASTPKDIFNGSMMLAGISALENSINKKSISEYPSPFGTQNDVKFKISKVELNSSSNNKIQTNSIIVKKSQGDDCISQTYIPVMEFDFFFVIGITQYGFHMSFLIGNCNGALITYITPWTNGNYGTAPPPTNGPSFNFTDNNQMNGSYLFNSNATSGGSSSSTLNQAGILPNRQPWVDPDASLYNQTSVRRPSGVLALQSLIPTLSENQLNWLSDPANSTFVNEFRILLQEEPEMDEEKRLAAKITIDTYMSGIQNSYDESAMAEIVQKYNPTISQNDPIFQKYFNYMVLNIVNLKKENPNWTDREVFYFANKEVIHLGLDILTFIPPFTFSAILINGVLYQCEGNGINAKLTLIAGAPFGLITKASFFTKFFINPLGNKIELLAFRNTLTGTISFGKRIDLRYKTLGLKVGNVLEAHHKIPWELCDNPIVQLAAENGFHMNELANGISLSKLVHREGMVHSVYNKVINDEINKITKELVSSKRLNPVEAEKELKALINRIDFWFSTHNGVNLDLITL